MDGNEAAVYIAYRTSEVIAIYPITPSSPMGESADEWAAKGVPNIFGAVPCVQQMQSEGGAAGAVHGALQTGSLTTTFTSSQGLLLMIPNMYKIAGELTSTVFHIAARSLATSALSIFGDHSDVMSVRSTGWGMLFGNSVQEVMDMSMIAQASTLESRLPFLDVFDGFRTSHEVQKINVIPDETISAMIDPELVRAHRARGLSPDHPVMRGTAQNPDVYFQAREVVNPFYTAAPGIVQKAMDKFAALTGRQYHLFDYVGAPDADRVIVMMGSGCETVEETVAALTAKGEKIGLLKVHLYRPFAGEAFLAALPKTVKRLAVMDRTKEPGGTGEPLYQDVVTAISEGLAAGKAPFTTFPGVFGGRYGLSSKEFTPAMAKGIYDELAKPEPKNHFTVGIVDDVSFTSIDYDPTFSTEADDVVRAMFYGLGADGTVGANKNTIKIIGEETPLSAQGYFVYDSKKSGSVTVSHLRFGPRPIHSPYLIDKAQFIGIHQFEFLEKFDLLDRAATGGTVLLNSPYEADKVWGELPYTVRKTIVDKKLKLFVIDGYNVAKATGMGGRINTIMQTCFFAVSGVLPKDEAIAQIKKAIKKSYSKRGQGVIDKNFAAVDAALSHLHEVKVPADAGVPAENEAVIGQVILAPEAPEFVRKVTSEMIAGRGDFLPVSAMPIDGTFPVGTTKYEKRNIALEVPVWEEDLCIQCGKCVMICPHACIRAKVAEESDLENAPAAFKTAPAKWKELPDRQFALQVSVEDCTGCTLCMEICPAKDKQNPARKALNMAPQRPIREQEIKNWDFFLSLPDEVPEGSIRFNNSKNIQLLQPLFEFSGACAGCGETPYLKLMSQLFGDRAVIANATGCSSIYGGNLPTTPWTKNKEGRGPAWSNSLFEDNAEFGLGMALTMGQQTRYAQKLAQDLRDVYGFDLWYEIAHADQTDDIGIHAQRCRVEELKTRLQGKTEPEVKDLLSLADMLVKKSVWIVGGDGWAYDIGYGGLDHVLFSGHDVNVLVLDTEVYSNTGGQASKATPRGSVAKFAAGGRKGAKKDLGRMAMAYGSVYVAQIALGANDTQAIKAMIEAESYPGASLVIGYGHCIAHGMDMSTGLKHQKMAVETGYWPLYRFNPRLADEGKNPFQLDSRKPSLALEDYIYTESRYRSLKDKDPEAAAELLVLAKNDIAKRWENYEYMAAEAGRPKIEELVDA
jgi:pyruvate-ferredoxin/flavodoxin oxidoreductase